jgi:hypothetical protein
LKCVVCGGKLKESSYQSVENNRRIAKCWECQTCGQKQVGSKLVGKKRTHYPNCAHCGSIRTVKNGLYNGKQRIRCRDCGKTMLLRCPMSSVIFANNVEVYPHGG